MWRSPQLPAASPAEDSPRSPELCCACRCLWSPEGWGPHGTPHSCIVHPSPLTRGRWQLLFQASAVPEDWAPGTPPSAGPGPASPRSAATVGAASGSVPPGGRCPPILPSLHSQSQVTLPPWSRGLGCFGGVLVGGQILIYLYLAATAFVAGRPSALLQGDIGDPLVVAPALLAVTSYFHQAVALPGVRVRVRDQEAVQVSSLSGTLCLSRLS